MRVLRTVFILIIAITAHAADTDYDGIDDSMDNCVATINTDQLDTDADGLGDRCDIDDDGDNLPDVLDEYPLDGSKPFHQLLWGITSGGASGLFVDGGLTPYPNSTMYLNLQNNSHYNVSLKAISIYAIQILSGGEEILLGTTSDMSLFSENGIIKPSESIEIPVFHFYDGLAGPVIKYVIEYVNPDTQKHETLVTHQLISPEHWFETIIFEARTPEMFVIDSDADGYPDNFDDFPFNYYEQVDSDNDGLGDNYELANGLSINSSDTDEDGISDYDEVQQGSDPLDINSPFRPSALSVIELQDLTGDGIAEIAQFGELNDGTDTPQLVIMDPVTQNTVVTYSWSNDWNRPQLIKLADRNSDGIDEVALYGKRKDDGRMQLVVKSGATGAGMGTWSWPNSWSVPRFVELKDISGDGQNEYAIFGRYSANNVPQLVVRDGVSKAEIARYKFTPAWKNEVPLQWDDLTHDGIAEAAMFGEHRSNGKTFLYVVDGNAPDLKLNQYNWPNKWANPSFHLLPDLDGDGIREPAVFGVNLDDGRPQLQIKKGNTKKGVYAIYNWLATFSEVQFYQLGDQNGDGVEDFGVLAYNSANDKRQLMVKDGMDRTVTLANYFWPDNWDNARIVELDDLTGDGLPEIGLIGNNRSTGAVQMQVKDRATRGLLNTYTFSATDSMTAKVINVGDVDGDGTSDVGVYNNGSQQGVIEIYSGSDSSVLLKTMEWGIAWY